MISQSPYSAKCGFKTDDHYQVFVNSLLCLPTSYLLHNPRVTIFTHTPLNPTSIHVLFASVYLHCRHPRPLRTLGPSRKLQTLSEHSCLVLMLRYMYIDKSCLCIVYQYYSLIPQPYFHWFSTGHSYFQHSRLGTIFGGGGCLI